MLTSPSAPDAAPIDLGGVRQIEGSADAAGLRVAIAVSRFNIQLTSQLMKGAVETLRAAGAAEDDIDVVWVPGAYEIPTVVERLAASGGYAAILALGCVIQGETPHAGLINSTVAAALSDISRRHGVPVIDTVVSAMTEAQAAARCASGPNCRGVYAARTAVEMARLMPRLPGAAS